MCSSYLILKIHDYQLNQYLKIHLLNFYFLKLYLLEMQTMFGAIYNFFDIIFLYFCFKNFFLLNIEYSADSS